LLLASAVKHPVCGRLTISAMSRPIPATRPARPGARHPLWRWPLVLGLLTASGLLSGLVSDGWGDVWAWVGLGVPVAVMLWFGLGRRGA